MKSDCLIWQLELFAEAPIVFCPQVDASGLGTWSIKKNSFGPKREAKRLENPGSANEKFPIRYHSILEVVESMWILWPAKIDIYPSTKPIHFSRLLVTVAGITKRSSLMTSYAHVHLNKAYFSTHVLLVFALHVALDKEIKTTMLDSPEIWDRKN